MDENMECPICKKKVVFVGVHDDEGNYHGLVGCEYENDPWSGLSYALHHEGWEDCPLCTDGAYSTMGGMLFDTAEEAINALTPPNEPLTLEQLREMDGEPVWVVVSQNWRESGIEGGWRLVKFHLNDDRIRLYMFDTHFGASFLQSKTWGGRTGSTAARRREKHE